MRGRWVRVTFGVVVLGVAVFGDGEVEREAAMKCPSCFVDGVVAERLVVVGAEAV